MYVVCCFIDFAIEPVLSTTNNRSTFYVRFSWLQSTGHNLEYLTPNQGPQAR